MLPIEHGHLLEYFDTPEVGKSLLEKVMHDQLGFNPRLLPNEVFLESRGVPDGTVLQIPIVFPQVSNNLWISAEDLKKQTTKPHYLEQSVSLFPDRHPLRVDYLYRYMGPRVDCKGLLQRFRLQLPHVSGFMIKEIDLKRAVIDGLGDQRYASVHLLPEVEDDIRQLLGLPINEAVNLVLIPGRVLVTKLGSNVVAELEESDLQKIGINGRLEDNEDMMVARVSVGKLAFTLSMGKKLKPEYPRFLFDDLSKDLQRMVTSCDLECRLIDETTLN